MGVAATVLAGGVAAAKSPAVSEALSEQADLAWERLEAAVPPLQVRCRTDLDSLHIIRLLFV